MISVVIPTYNRAGKLVEAVQSVFSQTYSDYEIIISDDGSTDNTAEIIQQFGDSRVRYLKNEHSGLPSVARNIALKAAEGKYIAFLDSDDLWLPDKLKEQVAVLDKHPEVGLVCSNAYCIDRQGKRAQQLYQEQGFGKSGLVFLDLLERNFVITSTAMARREVLMQAGGFPDASELQVGEDYALWLRIASSWSVKYLSEPLAEYRDTPTNSIRGKQTEFAYLQGMIYILNQYDFVQVDSAVVRQAINLRKGIYRQHLITSLWANRHYSWCALEFGRMMYYQPFFILRWISFSVKKKLGWPF